MSIITSDTAEIFNPTIEIKIVVFRVDVYRVGEWMRPNYVFYKLKKKLINNNLVHFVKNYWCCFMLLDF